VGDYLKIAEKAKPEKSGVSERCAYAPPDSSNMHTHYDINDQNDKRVGAICRHDVRGGCWLCRRDIERLVREGMATHLARAEVLGYVEEELEL
jgi:hypothetical protein